MKCRYVPSVNICSIQSDSLVLMSRSNILIIIATSGTSDKMHHSTNIVCDKLMSHISAETEQAQKHGRTLRASEERVLLFAVVHTYFWSHLMGVDGILCDHCGYSPVSINKHTPIHFPYFRWKRLIVTKSSSNSTLVGLPM